MKTLIVTLICTLSGCALTPWVAAHKLQIEAVAVVAGAVASVEGVAINTETLIEKVKGK